jgi:hypothetical protein
VAKQQAAAPENDFAKYLKKSSDAWDSAKKKAAEQSGGGGYGEYDDGKYLARLQVMEGGVNPNGAYIRLQFKFVEGEYENQTHSMFQNLRTDENMYHAARLIEKFGYELPDKFTDIPAILAAISKEKPLCKITIKTKGEYQNTFVDKVIDEAEGEDEESENDDDTAAEDEETEDEDAEESEDEGEEEVEEEEEEEEEEADDEEGDLEVGMRVEAETSKGTRTGVVASIDEKEGTVKIKTDDGKLLKVKVDAVAIVTEAPPEPPVIKTAGPASKKTGKK